MSAAPASRGRSVRFYDETWDGLAAIGTPSELIRDSAEAMENTIRCFRCFRLVPAEFGNLAGRQLHEWIADAKREVVSQKCYEGTGADRVPAHTAVRVGATALAEDNAILQAEVDELRSEARRRKAPRKSRAEAPVLVGAETASQPPPASGTAGQAATGEEDAGERTDLRAPAVEAARAAGWDARLYPEESSLRTATIRPRSAPPVAAESAPAAAVRQLREDIPGVTTASEMPRTATAVFQEPLGQRRVEHPVPAPADQSRKKARAKSGACAHRVPSGSYCKRCERTVP